MHKDTPIQIPTPDQVPNSLDISKYPTSVLQNSVVEELVQQNRDLMSRLTVNLRRNGELENRIRLSQEKVLSLKRQNEQLSESSLRSKEKEKLHYQENQELKNRLASTEIELYENLEELKEQREILETRNIETEKTLLRLYSYRRRIHSWVKPLIKKLYAKQYDLLKTIREYQIERMDNEDHMIALSEAVEKLEQKNQLESMNSEQIQYSIISTYESQIKELKNSLDHRDIEMQNSLKHIRVLEETRDKYVSMENKAIAAERMRFEIERKYDAKISELRQALIETKDKYHLEKEEFISQKAKLESLESDIERLSDQNLQLRTQFASGNKIHSSAFVELEELKAIKHSQEQEIIKLRTKVESLIHHNEELIFKLKTIEQPPKLPKKLPSWIEEQKKQSSKQNENANNDEIEKLIQEIESGYTTKETANKVNFQRPDLELK